MYDPCTAFVVQGFGLKSFKNLKKDSNLVLTNLFRFCILSESVVTNGILAQLGEHLPYKQRVTGSSPVVPTTHLAR